MATTSTYASSLGFPSRKRNTMRLPLGANRKRMFVQKTTRSLMATLIALSVVFTWAFPLQAHSPIVVRSIADLRALSTTGMTNDTVAYVIDYYGLSLLGHRGGGHFRWIYPASSLSLCCSQTLADDGGRFIACSSNTNGIWERILDGE